MKKNELLGVWFALLLFFGCQTKNAKTNVTADESKLRIEIIDPEALDILDTASKIEVIAGGFKWTEGPLYINEGNYLIFSDIPDNKIYKWKEGRDTSTYLTPSG